MFKKLFLSIIAVIILLCASAKADELPDTVWTLWIGADYIYSVKFYPNDNLKFVNTGDNFLQMRNTLNGEVIWRNKTYSNPFDLDFSPSGDTLVSIQLDGKIIFYNSLTGDSLFSLHCDSAYTTEHGMIPTQGNTIDFTRDGRYLIASALTYYGAADNIINVWDAKTFKKIKTVRFGVNEYRIAVSKDSKYFITTESYDNKCAVRLWRISDWQVDTILGYHDTRIRAVDISPDCKLAATIDDWGIVKVWDLINKKLIKSKNITSLSWPTISFSKDNLYLIAGDENPDIGHTYLYDFNSEQIIYTYNFANYISDLTDNMKYILVSADGMLYMLNGKFYTSIEEQKNQNNYSIIYPNPTDGIVNIEFTFPFNEQTNIMIYDIRGNIITTIFNDFLIVGEHSFQWNTNNTTNGTYLCKITANSFNKTFKIIVNK